MSSGEERGLLSRTAAGNRAYIGACNHFFLLNARNCGYARMKDLGCAVVCARNCASVRMGRFRMRSDTAQAGNCGYAPMDDLG